MRVCDCDPMNNQESFDEMFKKEKIEHEEYLKKMGITGFGEKADRLEQKYRDLVDKKENTFCQKEANEIEKDILITRKEWRACLNKMRENTREMRQMPTEWLEREIYLIEGYLAYSPSIFSSRMKEYVKARTVDKNCDRDEGLMLLGALFSFSGKDKTGKIIAYKTFLKKFGRPDLLDNFCPEVNY